jgi:hypothetical protein
MLGDIVLGSIGGARQKFIDICIRQILEPTARNYKRAQLGFKCDSRMAEIGDWSLSRTPTFVLNHATTSETDLVQAGYIARCA